MSIRTASTAAALSAAAALTLGLAGPAQAERYGIDDPNDSPHGSDLIAVDIDHRARKLVVVTTHDNLRRDPRTGSGGSIFIDTDASDPGPEYVFAAGFTRGTDYALVKTEGFRSGLWGGPVNGDHDMRVDYRDDTVRFVIPRATINRPSEVRIAVKVGGSRSDGTTSGLNDWLGEPRHWTPWIARG